MRRSAYHPFEFLKLVRDKQITKIRETYVLDSYSMMQARKLLEGLQELGFLEIGEEGEISTTDRLLTLISALDISLTQLTNYSRDSIVCSPLFGLPSEPAVTADIFVVMPFLEKLKPVYDDHIRSAAQKLNLTVARGDDFFTASSIVSDIWNAMNSCRIVIADCTGRNPNVFYEIGMAHTLGKPVIFISQNKDDIPFDIQYIRYILYEFTPRGMSEFEKSLISTIENQLHYESSYNLEYLLAKQKRLARHKNND